MGLKIGNSNLKNIFVGNKQLTKMYYGSSLLWQLLTEWYICSNNVPIDSVQDTIDSFIDKNTGNANFKLIRVGNSTYDIYYTTSDNINTDGYSQYAVGTESMLGTDSIATVLNAYGPYETIFIQAGTATFRGTIYFNTNYNVSWTTLNSALEYSSLDWQMYMWGCQEKKYGTYYIAITENDGWYYANVKYTPEYPGKISKSAGWYRDDFTYHGESIFSEDTWLYDLVDYIGVTEYVVVVDGTNSGNSGKVYYYIE